MSLERQIESDGNGKILNNKRDKDKDERLLMNLKVTQMRDILKEQNSQQPRRNLYPPNFLCKVCGFLLRK